MRQGLSKWLSRHRNQFDHALPDGSAAAYAQEFRDAVPFPTMGNSTVNPLQAWFDTRENGTGVFKWLHYFEVYHRHLAKYVGRDVNLLEIGILGGGSLAMWRSYFGDGCHVYGVDIDPRCRQHADAKTTIIIGDQADRGFWHTALADVPALDIIIDDGGHQPEQQRVTLEETLPKLAPGGVYICEDVHQQDNGFAAYATQLAHALNHWQVIPGPAAINSSVSPWQRSVHSLHFYPYMVVIEKREHALASIAAVKQGSEFPGVVERVRKAVAMLGAAGTNRLDVGKPPKKHS